MIPKEKNHISIIIKILAPKSFRGSLLFMCEHLFTCVSSFSVYVAHDSIKYRSIKISENPEVENFYK